MSYFLYNRGDKTANFQELLVESFRINKRQFLLGFLFLLAGTMEYVVSRPVGTAYFLNKFEPIQSFFHPIPNFYGKLGGVLPAFFHPLGLSLISMALFSSKKSRMMICLTWFAVDSVFELSQNYGIQLVKYLPKWFERVPILENLGNYLLNGRFDISDLMAIRLGSLTAFLIGELLSRKGESYERGH